MTIKNLWGEISNLPPVKSPVAILREQSQLLEQMTSGLLTGRITDRTNNNNNNKGIFVYDFFINAPSLNNYSYEILTIQHKVGLYPVDLYQDIVNAVEREEWQQCDDVEAFESALEKIFSSPEVRRVITGLLAQIQST